MAKNVSKKKFSDSAVHVQLAGPLALRKDLLEATLTLAQLSAHYAAYADVRSQRLRVMDKLAKVFVEFRKKETELAEIDLPPLPVEFSLKKMSVSSSPVAVPSLKKAEDDEVTRLQKEIATLESQLQRL